MNPQTWIVPQDQTIDIAEPITALRVNIMGGRLSVLAHDEPGTRIEIRGVIGRPLEVQISATGQLDVGYPFVNWENFLEKFKSYVSKDRVEVSISVPRALAVTLATVSGTCLLAGTRGDIKVTTVSGRAIIDSTGGAAALKTVSGDIEARAIVGPVNLATVSGQAVISGEVASLTATTVSGDVMLDTSSPSCTVKVEGVSSDVTIRRPAPSSVGARVSSISGKVVIDGVLHGKGHGRTSVDTSTVGGAYTWLQVTTVSGDVTVLGAPMGGGEAS